MKLGFGKITSYFISNRSIKRPSENEHTKDSKNTQNNKFKRNSCMKS